jgi:hypothetical protein
MLLEIVQEVSHDFERNRIPEELPFQSSRSCDSEANEFVIPDYGVVIPKA